MQLPAPASAPRASALLFTIAVHIALIAAWRMASAPKPLQVDADRMPAVQWIRALLGPELTPPAPKAAPAPRRPVSVLARPAERPVDTPAPVPSTPEPVDTTFSETAPVPSLRERALRDVGKIDQEMRKASPGGHISAPVRSPQSRLAAGINAATRLPRAWEAPRIEQVQDQGGYGRKIYKVTSASGVYCVYYDSNYTPNGIDMMAKGIKPKTGNCPRED
jgi:hypothetical protein